MKNIHELIRQHKTLFLPDIGTFFNDDIEIALGMVDKLGEANIPVIKAEILHDVDICLQSDLSEFYYSPSKERMVEENYRDIIERKVVSLDSYEKIFSRVKKRGCELVVSVYDNKGVDFGLWKTHTPSFLSCPLDVHSGNVARKLGILTRKQNDWKAVIELDSKLRQFDNNDPIKYDFALFGLGVFEKF